MLLLTTKGEAAKTGSYTTPVAYLPDGDGANARVVVFASKAGADTNPDWYPQPPRRPDRDRRGRGGETYVKHARP